MSIIGGIGGPSAPVRTTRTPRGDARFGAAMDSVSASDVREAAGTGAPSGACMLLSLQEVPDATERNRRARARAEAALGALRDMQLALLGGGLDRARLQDLAAAAASAAEADDPGLRDVAQSIGLRAAIELARLDQATG